MKPEPQWEVVVGHYGKILVLRFVEREQAQEVYDAIASEIDNWADYKNDRKRTVTVTDDIGVHTISCSETKGVSLIEIEPAMHAAVAYDRRFNALKNGEAEKASEGEGAEVPQPEPAA
jgi:hypothetical protein